MSKTEAVYPIGCMVRHVPTGIRYRVFAGWLMRLGSRSVVEHKAEPCEFALGVGDVTFLASDEAFQLEPAEGV